ncbi:carboxymuconolactone decarboxylase family protein [Pontibacter sp. JH31]|uniref:Carboxymuconolactone decarboxylase family protein n=1 Tax=Pontibacter aquaedesilientis TaxID=2766980 RepID=A0ABR7XI31_9BACT|nr:carboxymuconolactone decarboxylase family protein [Pontibacter aquaedesilientis]MBD1397091.1 carboxymuconolactone decarboxylase family protein [Pontibacter aquaedesilientis]
MNTSISSATSRFKMVPYEEATPEVKAIYDETMQALQLPFVLNWFKCQGNNATLLRGNWEKLRSTLLEGQVPNILKQLIIYNVSKERKCDYCAQAHGIFADSMGKMITDDENFKPTADLESPVLPKSYRTAVRIATKAALHTASVAQADFEELAQEGFSDEEVQELMAQADLVNMLNTIATISGIKLDNELLEPEF